MSSNPRTFGDALRRYWLLVAVFAVLFAGAGVAVGMTRQPVYSANTGLTIGQVALSVQSIPGFATGGQAVADTLSRSVTAPEVIEPAAKRLNLAPSYVAKQVSASPVPRTSTFLVYGEGSSERDAVRITNAVAASMLRYAKSTQNDPKAATTLLNSYQRAAQEQARAERQLDRIKRADTASTATYARVKAEVDKLTLRSQAASQAYVSNQQAVAGGALIERLAPAQFATDDKSSKTQLFGVLGAIAGGLIGAAFAVMRAARDARRRRAALAVTRLPSRSRETTAA